MKLTAKGRYAVMAMTDLAAQGPNQVVSLADICLLYTSPSPRDLSTSRMPSSA